MIPRLTPLTLAAALGLLAIAAVPASANPDLNLTVTVDTSSLVGNAGGPFSLDFQLIDGSGIGDGNNSALLTNFNFGGGAALGTPTWNDFGGSGVSGDLGSSVSLTDSDLPLDEFYQEFTPGSSLTFNLSLTTNPDVGGTPDLFSFAILDGNLYNLPTAEPFGTDNLVEVTLNGVNSSVAAYGTLDQTIGVPLVQSAPDVVPTWLLLTLPLAGFALVGRRSRCSARLG